MYGCGRATIPNEDHVHKDLKDVDIEWVIFHSPNMSLSLEKRVRFPRFCGNLAINWRKYAQILPNQNFCLADIPKQFLIFLLLLFNENLIIDFCFALNVY